MVISCHDEEIIVYFTKVLLIHLVDLKLMIFGFSKHFLVLILGVLECKFYLSLRHFYYYAGMINFWFGLRVYDIGSILLDSSKYLKRFIGIE